MSLLFQFEKNIENGISAFLTSQDLKSYTARSTEDLPRNNIQVGLQYLGANPDMRQRVGSFQEYDMHEGELVLQVSTSRDDGETHHETLGKIRRALLNHNTDIDVKDYTIFDIKPEQTTTTEADEINLDQSVLSYSIKWKINFSNI